MFVKLTGDKWVNTGNVCSVERETRSDYTDTMDKNWVSQRVKSGERVVYVVWFVGDNNKMVLSEKQGNELVHAIAAYDATREHRNTHKPSASLSIGVRDD